MAFEIRALQACEREECINLWCAVWPADNSYSYFSKYFYGDVEWLPYYTQVGVLDGKLVSAVHICKRVVACGDYRLVMGGIANVATLPDYRGRGYNTGCLERAVAVMEADAMDFSLLFTGIHDYYRRLGYSTIRGRSVTGTLCADFGEEATGYAVRPATPADLGGIYATYASYNARRPITVQRSDAYWRDWVGISGANIPSDLLVCIDGAGTVCGYVLCGTFRSAKPYSADAVGVRVIELGARTGADGDGDPRVLSALLAAVARDSAARGRTELKVDVCDDQVIAALNTIALDVKVAGRQAGMARMLHRENLIRAFLMQWNERWLAAGRPPGVVGVETLYGPVTLDATGPLLRVEAADSTDRPLSQADFLALLFGFAMPGELDGFAEEQPLLTALFPPCPAAYYGSDGF